MRTAGDEPTCGKASAFDKASREAASESAGPRVGHRVHRSVLTGPVSWLGYDVHYRLHLPKLGASLVAFRTFDSGMDQVALSRGGGWGAFKVRE